MKRPDFVEVFGQVIPIDYCEGMIDHEECQGEFKDGLIRIDSKLKAEPLVSTLLHEIVHAIVSRAGIGQAISHELEEVIAEQISTVLVENFILKPK